MAGQEVWKDIPGTEGAYQASSLGRIRSVERRVPSVFNGKPCTRPAGGIVLKPSKAKSGHLRVDLGRIRRSAPVHELVALAFLGARPEGKEVCHRDGNPENNRVDNLRYDTRTGNLMDRYAAGGTLGKLRAQDLREILALIAEGETTARIAEKYGVSKGTITRIRRGESRACKMIAEGAL